MYKKSRNTNDLFYNDIAIIREIKSKMERL